MLRTLSVLLFLVIGAELMAQSDTTTIMTDRPTQTASAFTVPKGTIQIETGFLVTRTNLGFSNFERVTSSQIVFNSTQVRVGVSDKLEFLFSQSLIKNQIRGGGQDADSDIELLPTSIGVRVRLLEAKSQGAPQIALLASAGGGLLSEVETGTLLDLRLNFQHDFGGGFGLGYNLVGNYNDDLGQFDGVITTVASYQANERVAIFGEVFATFPDLNDAVLQADLGLLYTINKNLQIDIFTGFGISQFTPDSMFGAGLSVKIPKK
jgi:hypothetical protein